MTNSFSKFNETSDAKFTRWINEFEKDNSFGNQFGRQQVVQLFKNTGFNVLFNERNALTVMGVNHIVRDDYNIFL
tara:strand:- start:147 stop:371 length:225 start_codon:yes stop_codon:yes gene_type:complete